MVIPPCAELADLVTADQPELVFAVVAPVGTDLEKFELRFSELLAQFSYKTVTIKLSDLAKERHEAKPLGVTVDETTKYRRIWTLMKLGNKLRQFVKRGDILALQAITKISNSRELDEHHRPLQSRTRNVHLLRSLKHPREVEALRRVYGPGFFLIGVHAPEDERLNYLVKALNMSDDEAARLIRRDQSEKRKLGQQTRDTFKLSDVFVTPDDDYAQLARFLDLVFGHPFITPTPDEHAMSIAYAASLRSAQLARQVGAAIVSSSGEVVATGANEVPRFGGGLYWPGDEDHRDHREGVDSNDREINRMIDNVIESLGDRVKCSKDELRVCLKKSRIGDVTEFGRVVHAEMEALLVCARTGVSSVGGTLYTTTFPCHNCAKHIVAAGIRRVIFVEPYPKSQAFALHADSVAIDDPDTDSKVRFLPFVGVAARRYYDLFSMNLSSGVPLVRKVEGRPFVLKRQTAKPRLRMSPFSYMDRERRAVALATAAIDHAERKDAPLSATCPSNATADNAAHAKPSDSTERPEI